MKRNILLSIAVQVVSLLVSVIMGLIIPKVLDELQYGLWQTFVLYVGYVGVLHFGLLDGIVLRYSQYNYDELDKVRIRSQFQTLFFSNILMAIVGCTCMLHLFEGEFRLILILVCIGIITKNLFTYNSFMFQITNRISQYAMLVLIQRGLYGVIVIGLIFCGEKNFYLYCLAELISDIIASLLGAVYNRGLYFGKRLTFRENLIETKQNVFSGIKLMFANWSAMLLIGSAKMLIQWNQDTIVFGKVSFAFSMANLFLTFVNAISIVLFPTLKRLNPIQLPEMYKKIRDVISPVLFIIMILYFPGIYILGIWLPKYEVSFYYLGIVLPIIIFSSKVSLLTNNYLKAYRKENFMLYVNVASVIISFFLFWVCLAILDTIEPVLICVVLMIMFRSVLSEVVVMKMIKQNFYKDIGIESIMTIIFICCALALPVDKGCILYMCALLIYLITNKNLTSMIREKR